MEATGNDMDGALDGAYLAQHAACSSVDDVSRTREQTSFDSPCVTDSNAQAMSSLSPATTAANTGRLRVSRALRYTGTRKHRASFLQPVFRGGVRLRHRH